MSKTWTWRPNSFFKSSTWARQDLLGWLLHFTLSHYFVNKLNGNLLSSYSQPYNTTLVYNNLSYISRFSNQNRHAQAHHKLLQIITKYTYVHIFVTVWTPILWPDIYWHSTPHSHITTHLGRNTAMRMYLWVLKSTMLGKIM